MDASTLNGIELNALELNGDGAGVVAVDFQSPFGVPMMDLGTMVQTPTKTDLGTLVETPVPPINPNPPLP